MPTTGVEVRVPASVAWDLLIDTTRWPQWGPSVRCVESGSRYIDRGSSGRIRTVFGFWLPFRVTDFVDGTLWGWEVAGIPATSHRVEPLGPERCRVLFHVPLAAVPYLAVCRVAAARIRRILEEGEGRT